MSNAIKNSKAGLFPPSPNEEKFSWVKFLISAEPDKKHLTLMRYKSTVLKEIAKRNQGVVAKELGMSSNRLSILVSILKEMEYFNVKV
jgi:hypothetical protein